MSFSRPLLGVCLKLWAGEFLVVIPQGAEAKQPGPERDDAIPTAVRTITCVSPVRTKHPGGVRPKRPRRPAAFWGVDLRNYNSHKQ